MLIRAFIVLSALTPLAIANPVNAGEDHLVDRHRPWETQYYNYCGHNPVSMRTFTAQHLSLKRCVVNFRTGAVRFHPSDGRTVAEWPVRGQVTQKIIGTCSCTVHD
jgi:hypothetical protein